MLWQSVEAHIAGGKGEKTNKLGRAWGRRDPNQKSGELHLTCFAGFYVAQVA